MRRPLIAGNWKMYGRLTDLDQIAVLAADIAPLRGIDVAICPPVTLLAEAGRRFLGAPLALGAQDVSPSHDGPFTGDVNAAMLAEAGARYVIVGHSERRAGHRETDELVAEKARAAQAAGLTPIICVGETLAEREAGKAVEIVAGQLAASAPAALLTSGPSEIVIAYEPVWAIGTGLTPSAGDIEEIHAILRAGLGGRAASTRLLYGGSVKPANAAEIFAIANVDGALVGGASLKAADFGAIIRAHPAARA